MQTNYELKEKLNAWRVEIDVPAGFQREVWARIAARERNVWKEVVATFSLGMARPVFAAGVLAVALLTSLILAHVNARETNERRWGVIESHYFASLDPYTHAMGK